MTTLREAAQQALDVLIRASSYYDTYAEITALRAALEQPEPEPAIYPDEAREMGLEEMAFYAHPPRREWQSLGKYEPLKLWGARSDGPSNSEIIGFARAIEAALKEKNHG